ncbi:hypothetical protein KPL70_004260 [Citrus sinensis]|nr:hypothetical protein KPL70_004260 [Citrus sinensis]
MNMTLTEIIRAMLRTVGLPSSFWAEAAKTACYIVNRSPSTVIGLKTAIETWTEKPTDYSYLHVFGCLVYVMYNAKERTKLDPKSMRCIFLGYVDGVKGYRLWDPTAHKIVINKDVIFVEDQLQRRNKDDSTVKEKSETIPVYVKNNLEKKDSDSSEAAPEHEEQESVESEALEVRLSTRERRPPTWHSDPDVALWMTMHEEIETLHKNKTWELVSLLHGRKAIGNKWVYKIKRDGNDQVERYRARLVVKGYAQKKLDVKTAFLHGELEKEIYMLQPESFAEIGKENLVCRYNRLNSDHCAYYKRFEDSDFIILLYVDDMLVTSPNKDRIQELKAQLHKEFEMKDLGPANKILRMQIHRQK